ncbi:hypothetical protein ADE_40750 [Achromobacter denitrificans]|nr:hypothetical protein ADE_40750 [Achromobacter denitrificans]
MTPCEPAVTPALALVAVTTALFEMVNVPEPPLPTVSVLEFVHEEPAPSTVTVPVALAPPPTVPSVLDTAPPFEMVSWPLPVVPTLSSALLFHCDPAPLTVATPTPVVS